MRHRDRFAQKYVFIVVGPLRFTSMHQRLKLHFRLITTALFISYLHRLLTNSLSGSDMSRFDAKDHITVVENRHIYRYNVNYDGKTPNELLSCHYINHGRISIS